MNSRATTERRPALSARATRLLDRSLADALGGSGDALAQLEGGAELRRRAQEQGLAPLLAARAGEQGVAVPGWERTVRRAKTAWVLHEMDLDSIGEQFGKAGVAWCPIKGADTATRVYARPFERQMSDIDVVVPEQQIRDARAALLAAGWKPRCSGQDWEDYFHREGYNWPATSGLGSLVEVHFRLWGSLPALAVTDVLDDMEPARELGRTAARPRWAHEFVITAHHLALSSGQRHVLRLWELRRIAELRGPAIVNEVADVARRWDAQLTVMIAARAVADYWGAGACSGIARALEADLRLPERLLAWRVARLGCGAVSASSTSACRLLAGRRSRLGLRHVWRTVRPHRAVAAERRETYARGRSGRTMDTRGRS